MAQHHYRPLGPISSDIGLQAKLRIPPTSNSVSQTHLPTGGAQDTLGGSRPLLTSQDGSSESLRLPDKSGILFSLLSGDKKGRLSQTNTKLEDFQQVSGQREIPHGDSKKHPIHPTTGGLAFLLGSEGRIPSCSDTRGLSQVPTLRLPERSGRNGGLRVASASLRSLLEPQGIHQDANSCCTSSTLPRPQNEPLHRRSIGGLNLVSSGSNRMSPPGRHTIGSRFCDKLNQVLPRAHTGSGPLGSPATDTARCSFRTQGQSLRHYPTGSRTSKPIPLDSGKTFVVHRHAHSMPRDGPVVHVPRQTPLKIHGVPLHSQGGFDVQGLEPGPSDHGGIAMLLGKSGSCLSGTILPAPLDQTCHHDRLESSCLRDVVQKPLSIGALGRGMVAHPHQPQGNESSPSCTAFFRGFDDRRPDPNTNGQCHGSSLSLPSGGDAFPLPEHTCARGRPMVSEKKVYFICSPHSGSRQLLSRSIIPSKSNLDERCIEVCGMGPVPTNCRQNFPHLGHPHSGSFCHEAEQESSDLLLEITRSSGSQAGPSDYELVNWSTLSLPSDFPYSPEYCENQKGGGGSNSNTSLVASPGMVSHGAGSPGGSPNLSPPEQGPPQGDRRRIPPFPAEPPLSCLEAQRQTLQAGGLSKGAAKTIGQALRPSTKALYQRKWDNFVLWCEVRDFHPLHCTIEKILEYLESLKDVDLKYNTIVSHVSALSNCLPLFDGSPIGACPLVCRWLRGYKAGNPPRRNLSPPWDLAVVLAALREPPYEPLESAPFKWLTLKTAFLIAITSVRRVSELQALCSVPPFVSVNPRSVRMRVNPAFCPKTATALALDGKIELHQFPSRLKTPLDREYNKNCPVRAVTLYLKRSKSYRKDNQFFVAFGENKLGLAVTRQTISRWISDVIKLAYSSMGKPDPIKANPHTTRGVAATYAELARAGMPAICEAATWSSTLSFARHYRLDFAGTSVSSSILTLSHS